MPRRESIAELGRFLRQQRAYWLIPILLVLIAVGFLLILASSSAVAPFIYTLF